jgi:hypothetical protein
MPFYTFHPTVIEFVSASADQTPFLTRDQKTANKIRSFASLRLGWHYGSGVTPTDQMIDHALDWNNKLLSLGFSTTDAFPGVAGEILVTAYKDSHYVEILLDTNSTLSLTYEQNDCELQSIGPSTAVEIFSALQKIAVKLWSTSGSFIPITLTTRRIDLQASRFETQDMVPQSSSGSAWTPRELPSANTFVDIIPASVENLQFFGFSINQSFQQSAA